MLASLSAFVALLSLPRRPGVFHRAHLVDREHGVSILERYSFSWVSHFFSLAKAGPLGLEHLPSVARDMRVRTLKVRHSSTHHSSRRLWAQLIGTFASTLAYQWILIWLKALCGFGGRCAIFRLLQILERGSPTSQGTARQTGSTESAASFWALGLGISLVMESLVGNRLKWLRETRLAMPMIALLNALVFEKSTRIQITHKASTPNMSQKQQQPGKKGVNSGGGAGQQSLTTMMATDW